MTVARNRRFVDGSGRRNNESSFADAYPYGSSTAMRSNSALVGTPMPTRMSPFVSSMLYEERFASTVVTSAAGELEPSLVRKIGSSPPLASNRICTCDGTIVQPSAGWWHDAQARPFVPRDWKNGLSKSVAPLTLYVRAMPVSFANPNRLGPSPSPGASLAKPSAAISAPETTTQAQRNCAGCMSEPP